MGGARPGRPVYGWGMSELMLPRLIERAATDVDGSLTGVVRSLIADPATDAERAGERLLVFGAPAGGDLASRRFHIVGERSGREYLSFTLALEDGPESLLEAFGLQLQIALNGLDESSCEELDCFRELLAAARSGAEEAARLSSAPARWWTSSQAGACQGGTPIAARVRMYSTVAVPRAPGNPCDGGSSGGVLPPTDECAAAVGLNAPMRVVTEFPRQVRIIETEWITMADGTRLAARIWLPEDAAERPVPAVFEFLPYRLNDGTAVRDSHHFPYLAGHGFACIRADIRGSGESEGILEDEYLPQEQFDACEVIAWIAEQPWCTGAVGMIGISWSGFNALQIAARRPPALKAIVTLCSTDDRYADDVHYDGGCVGSDMLQWASSMLGWNGWPPDPAIVGDRWREMWLTRLREAPPMIEPWLAHQRRDAYWKQGSVCQDYSAIGRPSTRSGAGRTGTRTRFRACWRACPGRARA
jgi:pimeloyl-ACP methyl ester carboxylesterase